MNRIQSKQITPIVAIEIKNLYDLRSQLKEMKEQEQAIAKRIMGFLESAKLSQMEHDGIRAVMSVCEKVNVDPIKFSDKVSEDDFYSSILVSTTEARRLLGDIQLKRISSVTTFNQLRLTEV